MAKDPVDNRTRELPTTGLRIGYARVSTAEQMQIDALRAAGVSRIYQETGSGMKADRPELKHCLAALRAGDTLCVERLDRLGRSLRDLVEIIKQIHAAGGHLLSVEEKIDTGTNTQLLLSVLDALVEFERRLVVERTSEGLAASRKQGRRGGRPSGLSEKDIQTAKALLASSDLTALEIAARLGVSKSTLYKYVPGARDKGGKNA